MNNVCPDCGGYKSAGGARCAHCARGGASTAREPLYCTCDDIGRRPVTTETDMCIYCLRAHKATVYRRYGWSLEATA